jgi:hypothetical protein
MWGQKSLAYTDNRPTCMAMSHAVLAMAHEKLDESAAARAELATVREMIKTRLPNGLDNGLPINDDQSGLWSDWIESFILLHEATADIGGPPPSPN